RGGELNVVLPFAEEDFLAQSVRPGGADWEGRFRVCMDAAASRIFATETGYVGDPEQFTYGTHVALGLTSIRARHILADAVQIAVLQPAEQAGSAGTARDVELWAALGHRTIGIDPGPVDRALDHPPVPATAQRAQHSILFADFAGFSQLGEAQLPLFLDAVMGRIAAVLDTQPDAILSRNTWGDALYAVIASPQIAAEIALAQQEALRELPPLLSEGLTGAGMRIGVHHGPLYRGVDPVLGKPIYYGTEVTRTARIEPVTPTGEVYVTQAFAAMLALEAPDRFALEYVGRIKLAKGYGTLAMYRLSIVRG
ncbi:MAG: adenylate/guanylate cyclase domain-containing protein, partial [Sphingomonadaceae bacterium]